MCPSTVATVVVVLLVISGLCCCLGCIAGVVFYVLKNRNSAKGKRAAPAVVEFSSPVYGVSTALGAMQKGYPAASLSATARC